MLSHEKRELFGSCAFAFGNVDTDENGVISKKEPDYLLETVAIVSCRCGLLSVSTMSTLERRVSSNHMISKIGKVSAKNVDPYHM